MAKFRKIAIEVEAEQWFPDREIEGVHREESHATIGNRGHGELKFRQPDRYYVVTIHEQKAYLDPGDWVITELDGVHHYPCKPGIFHKTYEPAKESQAK